MDIKTQLYSNPLEGLRCLINASIDVVLEDLARHDDPPLDIDVCHRHPLRDRYDEKVARALKCLSSSGVMLRALCDPEAFIHDMMFNFHDHTALFVACQADVANVLGNRSCSSGEIAEKTGIEADKLSRFLRVLSNMHIFREVEPDVYCNNELSLLFNSENRRALVGLSAEESRLSSCKAWDALTLPGYKNATGINRSAFCLAYNTDLVVYDYWREIRPELAERGSKAFAGKGLNKAQYFALYPWAEEPDGTLLVDVGGGVGGGSLPIVQNFSNLKLIVQDLPENGAHFRQFVKSKYADLFKSGRADFMGHDFFQEQPIKNGDIFFLRHVIHNWPDPKAQKLLSNLATSMLPTSKILICEHIVMPVYRKKNQNKEQEDSEKSPLTAPEPLLANWGASFTGRLDLQVLAFLNAKQRTEEDFVKLVDASGLSVWKVWRNLGDEVLVECRLKQ